ncbi:preprotein translocase subunit TatA [Haloprofundus marisrubri]|uniref:Sec-independent protein translocase protein TatA n=1 Tax=Haloprofundus marisrubri TaxID=1514971 RepID=A0A0W1R9S8_9EURY|nr:twin-arginine translocase TatA/TatE family subunit [Haloprofundus marisrubri]KTG09999.1 preprotein translocase subunit TatA [Haloprofundus marisrubri]
MFDTAIPLFGALPGGPEMLIILLIIVLLFGANKLPKLARSTGQAMGEFKKGREEIEDELQQMESSDDSTESTTTTSTSSSTTSTQTNNEATEQSSN